MTIGSLGGEYWCRRNGWAAVWEWPWGRPFHFQDLIQAQPKDEAVYACLQSPHWWKALIYLVGSNGECTTLFEICDLYLWGWGAARHTLPYNLSWFTPHWSCNTVQTWPTLVMHSVTGREISPFNSRKFKVSSSWCHFLEQWHKPGVRLASPWWILKPSINNKNSQSSKVRHTVTLTKSCCLP